MFLKDEAFVQRVGAAPDVESLTKQVYAMSSEPSQVDIRIAKLTYYAGTRDDSSALKVLRESASNRRCDHRRVPKSPQQAGRELLAQDLVRNACA